MPETDGLDELLKTEGVSRSVLEARMIARLVAMLRVRFDAEDAARQRLIIEGCLTCRGGAEYRLMAENLASTQSRCSELLGEARAARAEASALRVELDEATAMRDAFGQKAHQLQERETTLRAELVRIEWTSELQGDNDCCPSCEASRSECAEHAVRCSLDAALTRTGLPDQESRNAERQRLDEAHPGRIGCGT